MNVTCAQKDLKLALTIVRQAAGHRASCLFLTTDGERLRLSATSRDAVSVHCWVNAEVHEQGNVAAPMTMASIAETLPAGQVQLDSNGQILTIHCSNNRVKINHVDVACHLYEPPEQHTHAITLDPKTLQFAVQRVAVAASTRPDRSALTGILLQQDTDRLTLTASDGYRLATQRVNLPGGPAEPFSAVVPAQLLKAASHICSRVKSGSTYLLFTKQMIAFQTQMPLDVVLVSCLIPDRFPDYQHLIHQKWTTRVTVWQRELIDACATLRESAKEYEDSLIFRAEPDGLVIIADDDNTVSVGATMDGEKIHVSLRVKFVLDALKAIGTRSVVLDIISPCKPCAVRPVEDDSCVHVIAQTERQR